MDDETQGKPDPEDIPTQWHKNQAFTAKDALAMVSFLLSLVAPMLLLFWITAPILSRYDNAHQPGTPHSALPLSVLLLLIGGITVAALIGKYLWLIAMCRLLHPANVGPLVAYGIPRRISRLDRALIHRLYGPGGPTLESRLRPAQSNRSVCRLCALVFSGGTLIAALLSRLPLMQNDTRLPQLALLCGALTLLFLLVDLAFRRKPS